MSTLTRPKTPDRRGRKPPTISTHQSNIGKLLSATANRRVPANSSQIQTIRRLQEHNEKKVAEREEEENDDDDDDDDEVEVVPADPCEPRLLMLSSAYQRQNLLPCSDKFDPFASLPTSLNRFQEHL